MTKDQKNLLVFQIDNIIRIGEKVDAEIRIDLIAQLRESILSIPVGSSEQRRQIRKKRSSKPNVSDTTETACDA